MKLRRWSFASAQALLMLLSCVSLAKAFQQTSVPATPPMATSVREADVTCAKCHSAIVKTYLETPMANASGSAADRFHAGEFRHKPSGTKYSLFLEGTQPAFDYEGANGTHPAPARKLDYYLGSGHLGITYLYSIDHYLFETPIAYYATSRDLAMKPGLEAMKQASPALPVQAECIRCHMSGVRPSDEGTTNRYSGLPFKSTGITCESCHGDTSQHVASGGKAAVTNPNKLDAELRDSVCISCHLEGDVSVDRSQHSMFDFKPGESISRYRSYFVYASQGATRRGVSEVEQFSQSVCKRLTGKSMSCTNCHDPHFTPAVEQSAAYYRGKCLTCHTGTKFVSGHHPENPDCTSCHMPRTGAENTPHVAWTDHRILKLPEMPSPLESVVGSSTLLPVFSPESTARDLGLAYYKALLEGNSRLENRAYEQLQGMKTGLDGDRDGLDALAVLSEERGNFQQARELFKQVLSADPANLIAMSNLGTLLAKSGDLKGAIDLWTPAYSRNQDIVGLTKNLAQVQCMAGDAAGAKATIQQGLVFNQLPALTQMLQTLSTCNSIEHH